MAGNLIIPRVEVFWGDYCLTGDVSSNGSVISADLQPLVYNVKVSIQGTDQAPTGLMRWNPTGPAVSIYEKFLVDPEQMKKQIVVRYFYADGKSVSFVFVWAGQKSSYGKDMGLEIALRSELQGVINPTLRSAAQSNPAGGTSLLNALQKLEKQFNVDQYKLFSWSDIARASGEKEKIEHSYAQDISFGPAAANMIKQGGYVPFPYNIGKSGIAIFAPYSWEGSKSENVLKGWEIPVQENPDPAKRYGYLIGPSVVKGMERTVEWPPPQQTNTKQPVSQPLAQTKLKKDQNTPLQQRAAETQGTTSAPQGPGAPATSPGVKFVQGKDVPKKLEALNKEGQSKLSISTFMTPVMIGVKPHDIIFIPALSGTYMEDWVVKEVEYTQSDGGVDLSITATRPYGLGEAMNQPVADQFLAAAKSLKLVGENSSLEAWQSYSWPQALKGGG